MWWYVVVARSGGLWCLPDEKRWRQGFSYHFSSDGRRGLRKIVKVERERERERERENLV